MNSNRFWIALPVLALLGSIALAGYFWIRGPVYGEIEGRVTRGGLPLELVEVVFYSEEKGPRSWALTDKDGHFETMTDGIQKVPARKGAPVGKYRIALVNRRDRIQAVEQRVRAISAVAGNRDAKQLNTSALLQEERKATSGSGIPAQYNSHNTPFHDIEIKPGKNWFDLDVE
jgi:hypothetical protein